MKYQDIMKTLSQCEMGAVLVTDDYVIAEVNAKGDCLLHGEGGLLGRSLAEIAEPLCRETEKPVYASVAFGEYLLRCPTPEAEDLPDGVRLIVFREATNDACHDMLICALNQISESVILCDAESRIYLLNDAAVRMDSIVTPDVLGEDISSVYQVIDGSELVVPEAIQSKRPKLNHRQYYTTRYGKNVDIVSNTFPIIQNGQVLGGFSVMEDWSTVDALHKQILDLQEKLVKRAPAGKGREKSALTARYTFQDIISVSPAMKAVVDRCAQVAKSDSSVMICGETGTGKELFAQSIHNASGRADGPFLAINCAAIPDNLLEGLLFGTERGAYTGAENRAGLFEQADGGTLLLDEINSMNISLQAKLLRVLQDGVIRRVGGMSEVRVDVRVLSNINISPYQAIEQNILRRDLFYRLGVVNISIPPLRKRKEDIPLLSKRFIMRYNKKLNRTIRNVDTAALRCFSTYDWPGNVRELQHAIEHAMNILPDNLTMITPEYLPEHIAGSAPQTPPDSGSAAGLPLNNMMRDMEYELICRALRESGGNISAAARMLNMSRQNLQYHIRRYQLDVHNLPDRKPE